MEPAEIMQINDVFLVDKSQIKKLNDEQARELVARLCKAECSKFGLPESAVTWGGDQRAADGGVDVRVRLPSDPEKLDFIPAANTVFQVKAESFPPSKIPKEVAPKGKPRSFYEELRSENGAYIIVSIIDDCAETKLRERLDKMKDTLEIVGYKNEFKVDFYCSRRLADWVELHPSVAIWLKSAINEPVVGWKPYGPWAYKEHDTNTEYLIDGQLRVFIPDSNQSKNVETALREMRSALSNPCSIRVVGLSGVGKTRMIQAVFDDRIFVDQLIPSKENVIYCDLADEIHPTPGRMVEMLIGKNAETILVVDNCTPSEHQRLTEKVLTPGQKIKLITIEYDIREDLPDDTSVYRLDGSSKDLIIKLLKRNYSILSQIDAEKISEYCDGNARLAMALANTAEESGELAQLKSSDLFTRLFHQNKEVDHNLLRSAEAASLLYSFNNSDEDESEIDRLALVAECSTATLKRHTDELRRRGLVQTRGNWSAILPHAISNRLAKDALTSSNPIGLMEVLYTSATDRVAVSFSRRLGSLNNCHQATEIAKNLLENKLFDIPQLNDIQSQIFSNLAPLCPDIVLKNISLSQQDVGFMSGDNWQKGKYIRLARLIAFDPIYFEFATSILIKFNTDPISERHYEIAKKSLIGLFQINYSETHASLDQKLTVTRGLLTSKILAEQELGVEILKTALKTSAFSVSNDFDFGAHHRDYGWHPSTEAEAIHWFKSWLELAKNTMANSDTMSQMIRRNIANSYRGLWRMPDLQDYLVAFSVDESELELWSECWHSIKEIIHLDVAFMSAESKLKAQFIEEKLRPRDILSRVKALIINSDSEIFEIDETGDSDLENVHRRSAEYAQQMGEELSNDAVLDKLGHDLLHAKNHHAFSFGFGIGNANLDPKKLIAKLRSWINQTEKKSVRLRALQGIIAGLTQKYPDLIELFLDDSLEDEVWSKYFIALQIHGPKTRLAYIRTLKSIKENRCAFEQYSLLAQTRATDAFTTQEIVILVKALIDHRHRSMSVVFELLWMIIHLAKDKNEQYVIELRFHFMEILKSINWHDLGSDHGGLTYQVEELLEFTLPNAEITDISLVLDNFLRAERRPELSWHYDRKNFIAPFLRYFPIQTLDLIHQPDEEGDYSVAHRIVQESIVGESNSLLVVVPSKILIDWCDASPIARYPYMAAVCQLFVHEDGHDENKVVSISEIAIQVLNKAPDKGKIIAEYIHRFWPMSWSTSPASIIEERMELLKYFVLSNDPDVDAQVKILRAHLEEWLTKARENEMQAERNRFEKFE